MTGPKDAKSAILVLYDIMGYSNQILQGADILAYADSENPRQVFMPDFFDGDWAKMEWFMPPDDPENQRKLGEWFQVASPPKHLPKIAGILEEAERMNANIQSWGAIGYCWGGKMISILGGMGTKLKVGVQTSPALVDPSEAPNVAFPVLIQLSQDEPLDEFKKYQAGLKVTNQLEIFDQPHGWMSARADFRDAEMKKQYEKGYQQAADFLKAHM
jgi:dienelactone hydrolase